MINLSKEQDVKDVFHLFSRLKMFLSYILDSCAISYREFLMLTSIYMVYQQEYIVDQTDGLEYVKSCELQNYLHISKPAISKTLTLCENTGYIKKHTLLEDRRNVYVALTKKGEDKLRECLIIFRKTLADKSKKYDIAELHKSFAIVSDLFTVSDEF